MGLAVIPDDWSEGYVELCVLWPSSEQWRAILRGLLTSPNDAEFWDKFTGDVDSPKIAIAPTFNQNLHPEECMQIPVGTILDYAGVLEPDGFLFCVGTEVSRTQYSALFDVIGERYGNGDGTTTFNIPDKRGRVGVGWSDTDIDFNDVGNTGGAKNHTLSTAEIATHTHVQDTHTHIQNAHTHIQNAHTHNPTINNVQVRSGATSGSGANNVNNDNGFNTGGIQWLASNTTPTNQETTATNQQTIPTNQTAGGGQAHNNLPPYLVTDYIIKY